MVKIKANIETTTAVQPSVLELQRPAFNFLDLANERPKAAALVDLLETKKKEIAPAAVSSGASLAEIRNGEKVLVPQRVGAEYDPVVELVQHKLKELKITCDDGRQIVADGKFGFKTATAIENLRQSLGLKEGRLIDAELLQRIVPENLILIKGDSGPEVQKVQQLLSLSGIETGIDSKLGSSTQKSIIRFEKNHSSEEGFQVDGRLNSFELAKLESKVSGRLRLLGFGSELETNGFPAALKAFQSKNEIEATGSLSAGTLDKILSQSREVNQRYYDSPIVLRQGATGEIVRQLNQKLIDTGFDINNRTASDLLTKDSLDALRQFQESRGLPLRSGVSLALLQEVGVELRQVSEKAIALVKDFEGCYLKAKLCPGQVLTIGHGHTAGAYWGQTVTPEKADRLLRADLSAAALSVQSNIRTDLTQEQFDALVSFTFNLGDGWMNNTGLIKAIQAGDFESAAERLNLYCKAKDKTGNLRVLPGLVKRREIESEMLRPKDQELSKKS